MAKIQADGRKISPEKVVRAWTVPANGTSEFPALATRGVRPENMWMEEGDPDGGGLQHVISEHEDDFANQNIPAGERQQLRLPELAEAATTVGRHIGWASGKRNQGRPVMATFMTEEGRVYKNSMTVGNNGYLGTWWA